MKSVIKTILTTSALLLASTQVASAGSINQVQIQNVGYAGNGCPAGTAEVILSSDKQTASVIFDNYIIEAGGHGQRTFNRMKCDLAFGLKVPNGFTVALVGADYRGFTDLPRSARATFTRDYFFAGQRGPRLKKTWRGGTSDDFLVSDKMALMSSVNSACGADVILRSKTAATLRTRKGHEAMFAVDSADLSSKTVYQYNFRWQKC